MTPLWRNPPYSSASSDVAGDIEKDEVTFLRDLSNDPLRQQTSSFLMSCWTIFNLVLFSASLVVLFTNPERGRNGVLKISSFIVSNYKLEWE
jgi:hypothetical protein